jgi:hypothetical protein
LETVEEERWEVEEGVRESARVERDDAEQDEELDEVDESFAKMIGEASTIIQGIDLLSVPSKLS